MDECIIRLDKLLTPSVEFFLRCHNALKSNYYNRFVNIKCPICRHPQVIDPRFLAEQQVSDRSCAVCLETVTCQRLQCHGDHVLCWDCIQNMDHSLTVFRDLFRGKRIPKYVYQYGKQEHDRIGTGNYTIYEDRNLRIWVIVFRERTTDYFCFEPRERQCFSNLVKRLSKRYKFIVSSQGFFIFLAPPVNQNQTRLNQLYQQVTGIPVNGQAGPIIPTNRQVPVAGMLNANVHDTINPANGHGSEILNGRQNTGIQNSVIDINYFA